MRWERPIVAQAEPDGYTLLSSNSASNLTVPLIAKNAGYDPVADFSHIVMLTSSPYVLAVYPGLGVKTLAEFVAKARAQPLSYTAANRGGLGNMGGEYFQRLAGISMQHVPYRGGAPATADVIAGHVPAVFLPVTTVGEHVRAGKLVALAISSRSRVAVLPNVPTFAESGYPDLVLYSWFGLSGPKKLSPDIVARINREARAFLREPQMKKLAESDASEPLDADAAELHALCGRRGRSAGARSCARSILRRRSDRRVCRPQSRLLSSPGSTGRSSNHGPSIWAPHDRIDSPGDTGCPLSRA